MDGRFVQHINKGEESPHRDKKGEFIFAPPCLTHYHYLMLVSAQSTEQRAQSMLSNHSNYQIAKETLRFALASLKSW